MSKRREARRNILKIGLCVLIAASSAAAVFIPPFEKGGGSEGKDVNEFNSSNDMKVIVSLGETPESVFISWSESDDADKCREEAVFAEVAEKGTYMKNAKRVKAKKREILQGYDTRYWTEIKELEPGREYVYRIEDSSGILYNGEFAVPENSGSISFLYLGDVQFEDSLSEYDEWGSMIEKIYEENSDLDFAVIGGDMVNSPVAPQQWEAFLNNCGIFSMLPLMTVSGNHEGVSSNNTYKKIFAVPDNGPKVSDDVLDGEFYYFDCGECRFVMMDSSFMTLDRMKAAGAEKWDIMEASVEKWLGKVMGTCGRQWLIAVVHHPVYGMHEGDDVSRRIRKMWAPVMEDKGVDIAFCGHQHMYMRTKKINGIVYVMGNSGFRMSEYYNGHNAPFYSRAVYGGGPNYQIVKISASKIKLTSFNEKGLVIDETEIDKSSGLHIFKLFSGD